MKLLVIVLCLLSERFLIHSLSYQRFFWFDNYYLYIKKVADKSTFFTNPWVMLGAIVLPILLPAFLVYFLLKGLLFGLLGFILSLLLFFYCLGPQNPFYPLSGDDEESLNDEVAGTYFIHVNSQLFSVIFWYIAMGPIAALAYRLISLCKNHSLLERQARLITDILEWIPARITAFLYLLVGNFQRGFPFFTKLLFSSPQENKHLLSVCGLQAVRADMLDEMVLLPAAENLVEHATIVLLVFIALFTLVVFL